MVLNLGAFRKCLRGYFVEGGLHAVGDNRFLALTTQFPFPFHFCLPLIFKDYHPAVTTCFLSPDVSAHDYTVSTEFYGLLLSLISNYTWVITVHLKVKTCYEASPHFTLKIATCNNICISLGKIIIEISGISSYPIFEFTWSCKQSRKRNLPEILHSD